MILELADIRIHPGQNAAFEEAIQRGITTIAARAKGFQGYKVNRGIESLERYILQFFWDTLEDHTVASGKDRCFPSGVPSSAPSSLRRPLWSTLRSCPNPE
jgi:hypothetical protein